MKRYDHLYEKIYDLENLRKAHQHAKKGKGWYREVQEIDKEPDKYLKQIQEMLINHTYKTSDYEVFYKQDGKKLRKIYKLPYFPDRICQWAILQVIEPCIINNLTADTYSAIPNQITYIPVKGALLMANDNQIAFLCSRLKELREKNGCTMDDMAKKIDVLEGLKPGTGMNKSSISRVEGGKTAEKTLLEMARKYCKVFGMSESQTEQFLRGEKVAVPDTSALLKNSQLIDELNKEYSKVVIPKVVVDELDNIKNKNSGSLGRKAWEVIRGISYGSRTILMEYNGDADEDNEDCKIIYIAQEASETYHCKVDIITEDTDYSAYLKGHESVSALHLREYMATKQDLINMTKLARIDAYYADSYEECEEPTADEVNAYLQDGNTLIISAVRNNRATIEQRKEKIKWLIQLGADVNKRDWNS